MKRLSQIVAFPAFLPAFAAATLTFPDCINGPEILTSNLVCDKKASPAERAVALIGAWNITEKLANLVNGSPGTARLGLAPYQWWSEALHGIGFSPGVAFTSSGEYSGATSFASPILMSAAFDDELVYAIGDAISTEARAFSNAGRAGLDYWTPNINPYKDPRWGRGSETPGEDPFRIKGYVKALIDGLQGRENTTKVIATCKHYVAYDLEDWHGIERFEFDAIVPMQDLVEYYLPPFQQCARDSKVKSLMCSYNSVNGTPACASTYLMETVLRDFWEWTDENQYVTSDCNAVLNFHRDHNYTKTAAQSAAVALTAGTDTICEVSPNTDVVGAWNKSLIEESVIDQALRRLYEGLIRAGYFDAAEENPYRSLAWKDVNTTAAQELALRSAVDGIVLKKNNGVLPIVGNNASVALIGFWAGPQSSRYLTMLGGYSGMPSFYHTPLYAAQKLGFNTTTATGPVNQSLSDNDTWTTAALEAAGKSDIIVYFGGIDMSVEAEGLDRDAIAWPGAQLSLIETLCALGKPCVVVELGDQNDDTPLLMNSNVSAILWAGFPGQDGGTAVFDILTGKSAPAGRLPSTVYPADYVNQVPMTDMTLRPSNSSPGRTYKWYNESVLPFGFGLHYTTFDASFSNDGIAKKQYAIEDILRGCTLRYLDLCDFNPLEISVRNTGNVTSDFIALAFLAGEHGPTPYPIKELAAYTRLKRIGAGEVSEARLNIKLGELARIDENGNTVLYPGKYQVLLDVPTQDQIEFELTGNPRTLIEFPQPPKDLGEGNGHDKL
ncbi:glycoside hydrolase family 3 protein [Xylaria bambusicola]|uniref:glycoside hydrolase family 3 protein n=1 Tax=Xylaria bambusicola TaxID=326684 RepID=UPI00200874D5|nr:glycoside hydrolase family 3 protein [Xylaria bambusicola]KAI0505814.1 glycoside hydrolase family 3 protein [Xylaria bambusicola]